jgi:hypothetical protein
MDLSMWWAEKRCPLWLCRMNAVFRIRAIALHVTPHYLQDLDLSGFKNLTGLAKITCA